MPSSLSFFSFFNLAQSGQQKLRCLWVGALLLLSLAASANAQLAVRPEVAKSLQLAQDALNAGLAENAITHAQEALSIQGVTDAEKAVIQRTLAVAALNAKNFSLAVSTLEAMIQELPEGSPAEQKLPLIENLLSVLPFQIVRRINSTCHQIGSDRFSDVR